MLIFSVNKYDLLYWIIITFIYDYWKSRSPPTDIIIIQSEQIISYKDIHQFLGAFNSTMVAKCQHIIGFLLASAATLRSSSCCCSLATASAAMSDNHHVCMIQLCWYWLRSEQRIGTSLVVGLNTISLVVLHEWHLLVLGQLVIMNEEDFAFSEQYLIYCWVEGEREEEQKMNPYFQNWNYGYTLGPPR